MAVATLEQHPAAMVDVVCTACGSSAAATIATGLDFEYHTAPNEFHMVRCQQCSVIRLNPRPAVSELNRIYPPQYLAYNFESQLSPISRMARKYFLRGRVEVTRKLVGDKAAILDAGCGNGDLLFLLKDLGSPEWYLAGSDLSEGAAEHIRQRGIDFFVGRFEDMQARVAEWDVIWMKDVIEHLDDPNAVMKKAHEMLRPGGYLIMETPNSNGWDARLFGKRYWGGWHFPRHWTVYNPDNMTRHLQTLGYEVVQIAPTLSPTFWAQSIHHWWSEVPALRWASEWFTPKNFIPMIFFTLLNIVEMTLTRKTGNMQVIARKPE